MLSSIRIPRDLVVETCFIGTFRIYRKFKGLRDSELININSVLLIFRVSLFAEKPFVDVT